MSEIENLIAEARAECSWREYMNISVSPLQDLIRRLGDALEKEHEALFREIGRCLASDKERDEWKRYVDETKAACVVSLRLETARADRLAAVAEERLRLLRYCDTPGGAFDAEMHVKAADSVWAFGDVEVKS